MAPSAVVAHQAVRARMRALVEREHPKTWRSLRHRWRAVVGEIHIAFGIVGSACGSVARSTNDRDRDQAKLTVTPRRRRMDPSAAGVRYIMGTLFPATPSNLLVSPLDLPSNPLSSTLSVRRLGHRC
jgi:hypothetical protein